MNSNFFVFGLTRPGIESRFSVKVDWNVLLKKCILIIYRKKIFFLHIFHFRLYEKLRTVWVLDER